MTFRLRYLPRLRLQQDATMLSLKFPAALSRPVVYALGLFATKGIALIMLPVLAHHLSVRQVGQLELYTSSGVFLGMVLGLALHEALYRYAGHETCTVKQTRVAGQIYTLAGIVAALALSSMSVIIWLSQIVNPDLPANEILLLVTGVSIEGLIGLQLAWLRMQDRAGQFLMVTVCTCLLQVTLVAFALWLMPGILTILAASVIAHLVQVAWLQRLCQLPILWPGVTRIREWIGYSVPIALSGLVAFGLNGAERWVIASQDSIESLAHYAIAAKFALALCILVQPFGMWWMPKRFAVVMHQGRHQAARITQYGMIWIAVLCASMAYFAPMFITLTLPAGYVPASQIVLVCLVAAVCKELTELVNIGLLLTKQTKRLLHFNMLAAISGALLIAAMLPWGIWGILSGLAIAQLFRLILVYRASQAAVRLPYALRRLTSVILCALVHILIATQFTHWHGQLLMAFLAPLSVIIIAALTGLLPICSLPRRERQTQAGRV